MDTLTCGQEDRSYNLVNSKAACWDYMIYSTPTENKPIVYTYSHFLF